MDLILIPRKTYYECKICDISFAAIRFGFAVFSPDKKLKMAIQRHNDGLLTYTFAANREILIKESPLGFKLESQETVPSSGWKIEKVSDRKVRDEWKPLWGKRAVVEDHFNELVID